jgi:hygromycin-B 4-O-kinase
VNFATTPEGQIAQTFSFVVHDREHFIQFHHANMSQAERTEAHFLKEFELHEVPIRHVVEKGCVKELYYTVSEKVHGVPLASLPAEDLLRAMPSVLENLARISQVDTTGTAGYGWLDETCQGKFESWPDHLLGIWNEDPKDFYGHWHSFFDSTFLEKEVFDFYFGQMRDLLPFVPNVRRLVHGDYGYGNVFLEGGNVSAILDWQNGRYGDPAFDLAGMLFWREFDVAAEIFRLYRVRASSGDFMATDLSERVKCYLLYLGLDGLRFSARTDNRGLYDHVLTLLDKVSSGRHH